MSDLAGSDERPLVPSLSAAWLDREAEDIEAVLADGGEPRPPDPDLLRDAAKSIRQLRKVLGWPNE